MLIGATALLLVSCGGLTAAKGETGAVSFSMPPAMINGKDSNLTIALEKLFSTPYFLWNIKPYGAETTLYTSENLSRKTELGEGSTDFCFDDDATLWTIENDYVSDKGQIWKYVNNQKTGPYTIAGKFYISSLDYDFEANKFFALYQDTEDWSYHLKTFDAAVLKSMEPG